MRKSQILGHARAPRLMQNRPSSLETFRHVPRLFVNCGFPRLIGLFLECYDRKGSKLEALDALGGFYAPE